MSFLPRRPYSSFVSALSARLRAEGCRRLVSRHRPGNKAVLEAKRKLGFTFAGETLDPAFGRLICLEFRI